MIAILTFDVGSFLGLVALQIYGTATGIHGPKRGGLAMTDGRSSHQQLTKRMSEVEYIQRQSAVSPEGGHIEDSAVRDIIGMVANRLQYLRVVQRAHLTCVSEGSGVSKSRLTRIELRKTDCSLREGILTAAILGVRFSDILRYAEDEIVPVGQAPWIDGRQSPSVRFVLEMEPFDFEHGPRHHYANEAREGFGLSPGLE